MATDYFLEISSIKGECTDAKHKDWIELVEFSLGLQHAVTGSLSSGGSHFSERADFKLFTITKTIDAGTPKLFLFCAKGTPIPKLTVHLCRATGEKATYMAYIFENCHVQGFDSKTDAGTPSGGPAFCRLAGPAAGVYFHESDGFWRRVARCLIESGKITYQPRLSGVPGAMQSGQFRRDTGRNIAVHAARTKRGHVRQKPEFTTLGAFHGNRLFFRDQQYQG